MERTLYDNHNINYTEMYEDFKEWCELNDVDYTQYDDESAYFFNWISGAIVYDYIEGTTKELTLILAHNAGQCPQCYIADTIIYAYHLPTDVAVNLAMVICNIMEIS